MERRRKRNWKTKRAVSIKKEDRPFKAFYSRKFAGIKDMSRIQRKKIIKSKRRTRSKSMIKNGRPFEGTNSEPMEIDMQENYDILLEILSRLPVKSLLRFMCVSKQWKTLISSSSFRKLHREKHTSSPPLLIACYNTYDIENPPYDPNLEIYTYLITSDLEGKSVEEVTLPLPSNHFSMAKAPYQSKLLCFVNEELKKFYLFNPSTGQAFLLTNPSSFSSPDFKEHYSTDYGYIPSKDEYIMVHLLKLSNGNIYCEVLENISISNDNFKLHYSHWRSSSTEATIIFHSVRGPTAFVGGAFYWQVVTTDPEEPEEEEDGFILSFDVKADSFSTINYPPGVLSYAASLMDIKNDLYLMFYPESPPILVMWKWSSDNKLWSPHWKFDFRKLFEKVIGFSRGIPNPLGGYDFIPELFIYTLKYLKGYEDQPPDDDQALAEIGYLDLPPRVMVMGIPPSVVVAVHSNLFTL